MKKFNTLLLLLVMICSAFLFVGCNKKEEPAKPTSFKVVVAQNENGTIGVNKTEAQKDDEIIITASPNNDCSLYAILCDGVVINSNKVKMPEKDIIISAIFMENTTNQIELTLGNYVQISDASIDGTSANVYTFLNTFTFKGNNICDISIWEGGKFIEIKDLAFTRNGNNIIAKLNDINYQIIIVDSKTLALNYGSDIITFRHQNDETLALGNYQSANLSDSSNFKFNIKSNNKIDFSQIASNSSVLLNITDADYLIKGNNIFIETTDMLIFGRVYDIKNDSFILNRLCYFNKNSNETYPTFFTNNYGQDDINLHCSKISTTQN